MCRKRLHVLVSLVLASLLLGSVRSAEFLFGACEEPLVVSMPDSSISASSSYPGPQFSPPKAKIYNQHNIAWALGGTLVNSFIQFTFPTAKTVRKVATAGMPATNQFVRSYTISLSSDGRTFQLYGPYGTPLVFQGNVDSSTVKENWLPETAYDVKAIRINPLTYHIHVALKVEVFGC